MTPSPICSAPQCPRPAQTAGLCGAHYKRSRRGRSLTAPIGDVASDPETRFWAKVDRSGGPDACWPWMGSRDRNNYGHVSIGGRDVPTRRKYSHRVAYEFANGPISQGLNVCHACDYPPCCNPTHLWLGTQADNMTDMAAKGRAKDPACPRGHEFTSENTVTYTNPRTGSSQRICRTCRRNYKRKRKTVNG